MTLLVIDTPGRGDGHVSHPADVLERDQPRSRRTSGSGSDSPGDRDTRRCVCPGAERARRCSISRGVEWIRAWGPRLVVVLFGSVFIGIGNLLPRTRPNLALGIRTSAHVERSRFLDSTPSHMRLSLRRAWSRHRDGGPARSPARRSVRSLARPHSALSRLCSWRIGGSVVRKAGVWALRVFLALVFVAAGVDKFLGAMWVRVFNDIGFGQWFRYVTGIVELLGGLSTSRAPSHSRCGVPFLSARWLGALLVHVTVVGIGPPTVAVSVLLALLLGLWLLHRRSDRLIPNP